MPTRAAGLDVELVEDLPRERRARAVRRPLRAEPLVQLVEPVVRVEDAAHDELRRDGAVPTVLVQAERDVVAPYSAEAVQLRPLPECNRAAGVAPVALHAEAEMLAVADRRQVAELAARREQRHVGIAEPERREQAQLLAEIQGELRAAREHRVDNGRRDEV